MLFLKKQITCVLVLILFSFQINAQSTLALSTGISVDLNNKIPFYIVPITIHWEPFKKSSFFIDATKGIGFNKLSKVDAYTANGQLPQHVTLTEEVLPKSFSVGIGWAIKLYTNKKDNKLIVSLSTGIISEHYAVTFRDYDQENYEVLNPDANKDLSGLYASIAGLYNFHLRKQNMFIMLRLQSPSSAIVEPYEYKSSYNRIARLQLTFGYNFFYTKK